MSCWAIEGRDVTSFETNGVINVRHQGLSRRQHHFLLLLLLLLISTDHLPGVRADDSEPPS